MTPAPPNFRIFTLNSGKTVTISGLTITNGNGVDVGGGIYNDHSTLTVTNSTISGNSSLNSGGGIYNDSFGHGSATLTVTNSTISENLGGLYGGGIFNDGSTGGNATLTIANSTISGNSSTYYGGCIYSNGVAGGGAALTITNSTISGNSATLFYTGGIYSNGHSGSGTLTIGDTILKAGASGGGNIFNNEGNVHSLGYNLSSDAAGGDGTTVPGGLLNATGDIRNTDPMLDPNGLQDNGGPTLTIALQPNSPAITAGDPNFTPPPDYDQRGTGFPRVVNNRIDIGAFEVQTLPPCPQPQGYWKNNSNAWPVNSLTLGSQSYTKAELITILKTRIGSGPRADASLILADQLIAAKLNIANGADGTLVTSTIADADAVLSLYPRQAAIQGQAEYNEWSADGQRRHYA